MSHQKGRKAFIAGFWDRWFAYLDRKPYIQVTTALDNYIAKLERNTNGRN